MLTIDQIKGADDRPYTDVEVPEWGGVVRLRCLSLGIRTEIAAWRTDEGKEPVMGIHMALTVAAALENEDGTPFFENFEVGAEILLQKSPSNIQTLYDHCKVLNKETEKAEEAAAKKSKPTRKRGSS